MDGFDIFHYLAVNALTISLAATRISIIFIMIPLFTPELIPPLVRNSIFLSLALVSVIVQPALDLTDISMPDWIVLYFKEAVIGILIGGFFGIYLWAFETAGQIIDSQAGASVAQVHDPLTGTQTTLLGSFLGRFANYIFVSAGGLILITGFLLESYYLWPLDTKVLNLNTVGLMELGAEFAYYFQLAILIAAPVIVIILVIDLLMGLINRYAQQFNVFFLSLSLKMLAATSVLFITIIALVELLVKEIQKHSENLTDILKAILGG
jgi:type III secretion protein T